MREVRLTGRLPGPAAAAVLGAVAVAVLGLYGLVGGTLLAPAAPGIDHVLVARMAANDSERRAAELLTTTADREMALLLICVLVAFLWWRTRRYDLPLMAVVGNVGAAGLVWLAKLLADRPRPNEAVLSGMTSAFPSGHATRAMFLGLLLTWLLLRYARSIWRYALATMSLLVAAAIGSTRVILGVHWPTDVIGGWALAAIWFTAVLLVLRPRSAGS